MNATFSVVGPRNARPSAGVARADAQVAVFAGLGSSLILAAVVLLFGRRRPHPVFSGGRVR
ncbi:MAG: hypothetical protein HY079_05580 [Elusimicrobia bacterium]|nr:hypothetical protein [Elusimicrobiota bacterium]